MLLAVLMGLELECGQTVDQVLDQMFSGDLELGLKVLGKYSAGVLIRTHSSVIFLICDDNCVLTAQCIENPYAYLAKRLANTKVRCCHLIFKTHKNHPQSLSNINQVFRSPEIPNKGGVHF